MPEPIGTRVHLDAIGGIAGDMFVAAMLAARPDLEPRVMDDCVAVLPAGCLPRLSDGRSGGLAVRRFGMDGEGRAEFTGYHALSERIANATLHPGTQREAHAILRRLAEAEAAVHGVPLADVHFHEIADWDSLMDVVAAGSIAAALEGAVFTVSPLPLGGGTVKTQHGMMPIPAPATAELLKGFTFVDDGVGGERVTPTGAAILAHLAAPGAPPTGRLAATGLGAGTRALPDRPNILRALLFEPARTGATPQNVAVLTFDVDDMTGEEIAIAAEHLRAAAGVVDVSLAARFGKKGRPATEFRLLAAPDALDDVAARCLEETTTIGLRWHIEARKTLPREEAEAAGVRIKRAQRPSGRITAKAEADDLAATEGLAPRRTRARLAETDPA